ncbi:MAG: hypothetical protein ACR2HJ_02645 [Fimbriimonadales bacterium]
MSLKNGYLSLSVAAATMLSLSAVAITRRDDLPDAKYLALGATFEAVGLIDVFVGGRRLPPAIEATAVRSRGHSFPPRS